MIVIIAFFIGLGIGGSLANDGTVYMEFCPPSKRRTLVAMSISCICMTTLAAVLALIFTASGLQHVWRFVMGSIAIISIITSIFRLNCIETPFYFIAKG